MSHEHNIFRGVGSSAQIGAVIGEAHVTTNIYSPPPPKPIPCKFSDPDVYFTGRSQELNDLLDWTINPKKLPHRKKPIVVVSGLGGVGKTQLVLEFISQNYKFYKNNIIWINAQNINKIEQQINTLANRLEIRTTDGKAKDLNSLIEEVFHELCGKHSLFVLDNVNRMEDIKSFLNKTTAGVVRHIIITTRISKTFSDGIHHLKLGVFNLDDACKYVSRKLNNKNYVQDHITDITELVKMVQMFPLALKQATAYIIHHRFTGSFHIKDYIREFNTFKKKMLDSKHFKDDFLNEYELTTLTTWEVTIGAIKKCEPDGQLAIRILHIIAYFDSNHIRRDIFFNLKSSINAQILDENEVKSAVELLVNYSMVDSRGQQSILHVHRLVQDVVKIRLEEVNGLEQRILGNGLYLILEKNKDEESREELHEHGISVFVASLKFNELVHQFSTFPATILNSLNKSKKYYRAIHFGDQILPTLTNILGEEDPNTIDSRSFMAEAYEKLGKYHEAHREHKEIFAKRETVLNRCVVHSIESMYAIMVLQQSEIYKNIARTNQLSQLSADAMKILEKLYEKRKNKLGNDNAGNLVNHLQTCQRKRCEELDVYEKILEYLKLIFSKHSLQTLEIEFKIACLLEELGEYGDSLRMHRKIFEERKVGLGMSHRDTLISKFHVAKSPWKLERHTESFIRYREIFEDLREFLCELCGQPEALERHRQLFKDLKFFFGKNLKYGHGFVRSFRLKFRMDNAISFLDEHFKALSIQQEEGADDQRTLGIKSELADFHFFLGNRSEALKMYKEVFEKQKTILGENHKDTIYSKDAIFRSKYYCEIVETETDIISVENQDGASTDDSFQHCFT